MYCLFFFLVYASIKLRKTQLSPKKEIQYPLSPFLSTASLPSVNLCFMPTSGFFCLSFPKTTNKTLLYKLFFFTLSSDLSVSFTWSSRSSAKQYYLFDSIWAQIYSFIYICAHQYLIVLTPFTFSKKSNSKGYCQPSQMSIWHRFLCWRHQQHISRRSHKQLSSQILPQNTHAAVYSSGTFKRGGSVFVHNRCGWSSITLSPVFLKLGTICPCIYYLK